MCVKIYKCVCVCIYIYMNGASIKWLPHQGCSQTLSHQIVCLFVWLWELPHGPRENSRMDNGCHSYAQFIITHWWEGGKATTYFFRLEQLWEGASPGKGDSNAGGPEAPIFPHYVQCLKEKDASSRCTSWVFLCYGECIGNVQDIKKKKKVKIPHWKKKSKEGE